MEEVGLAQYADPGASLLSGTDFGLANAVILVLDWGSVCKSVVFDIEGQAGEDFDAASVFKPVSQVG